MGVGWPLKVPLPHLIRIIPSLKLRASFTTENGCYCKVTFPFGAFVLPYFQGHLLLVLEECISSCIITKNFRYLKWRY